MSMFLINHFWDSSSLDFLFYFFNISSSDLELFAKFSLPPPRERSSSPGCHCRASTYWAHKTWEQPLHEAKLEIMLPELNSLASSHGFYQRHTTPCCVFLKPVPSIYWFILKSKWRGNNHQHDTDIFWPLWFLNENLKYEPRGSETRSQTKVAQMAFEKPYVFS